MTVDQVHLLAPLMDAVAEDGPAEGLGEALELLAMTLRDVPRPLEIDGSRWSVSAFVTVREGAPVPDLGDERWYATADERPVAQQGVTNIIRAPQASAPTACIISRRVLPLVRWCDYWDFVSVAHAPRPFPRFWVGGVPVAAVASRDLDEPGSKSFDLLADTPGRIASRLRGGR